ncbi:hypothetical protein [Streptomyces sp. AK08-01B]|uniref:hypothetical protein n=1 Tax=unclassified Streptomyces TaxID=2593676 RepID=UPI0039F5983F
MSLTIERGQLTSYEYRQMPVGVLTASNACIVCSPYVMRWHFAEGVISQGLFSLPCLADHGAEFQHLVRERLGGDALVRHPAEGPHNRCADLQG